MRTDKENTKGKPVLHCRGCNMTKRERQIAQLVAEGLRNKDIAKALAISDRTVQTHLAHIYRDTGFKNRTQLTKFVITGKANA